MTLMKVNLRRGRSVSSRWHSMESLDSTSRGRGRGAKPEAQQQRPRSRDSLGPRGFTSMVNLLGQGGQAGGRSKVVRTESVPPPDSLSLATSCSCTTEGREEEPIPRQAMQDGKKTKVEYLGSVPIDSKATDLSSLQVPMKNLYLKFIDLKNMGHQQLPGTLEISETGLKVNYIRELHRGVQEIFNPFPTIAVWAAVKFVHKKEHSAGGEIQHRLHPSSSLVESSTVQVLSLSRFAFLPLIADPDDSGKTDLFHHLSSQEAKLAAGPSHPGNWFVFC